MQRFENMSGNIEIYAININDCGGRVSLPRNKNNNSLKVSKMF